MGVFRGSKNQQKSPGNVMNCAEKKVGKKIKSPGNFMSCRENRYICLTPLRGWRREGRTGVRGQGGRKGEGGRQGRRGPSEAG